MWTQAMWGDTNYHSSTHRTVPQPVSPDSYKLAVLASTTSKIGYQLFGPAIAVASACISNTVVSVLLVGDKSQV